MRPKCGKKDEKARMFVSHRQAERMLGKGSLDGARPQPQKVCNNNPHLYACSICT